MTVNTYRPQAGLVTNLRTGGLHTPSPPVRERHGQPVARAIVRENLHRSLPFSVTRAEPDVNGDGLTMTGTAAVFNQPTIIDSWEGRFKEQLAPGSFRKTLSERTPKLQFDHGMHPLIGSLPIGRITDAHEDKVGVQVSARLSSNWLVAPVREAIADGTVDGMSFRFTVTREEWVDENGKKITPDEVFKRLWMEDAEWDKPDDQLMTRTLKEVSCAELGPVVFPAYDSTTVGVRSITIDLGRLDLPAERAKLARAILAADQAETPETEVGPTAPPTDQVEHPEATEAAAPPANAEHPASSHPDETREDPASAIAERIGRVMSRIRERKPQP
jgi:HK97 family phage prohead protease